MGKVGETPGVVAPINPKYMYFNVMLITFSQISVFQAPINRYWCELTVNKCGNT